MLLRDRSELIESDVGQAIKQRVSGETIESDLRSNIGTIGEVIGDLRVVTVPVEIEAIVEVVFADRVAEA